MSLHSLPLLFKTKLDKVELRNSLKRGGSGGILFPTRWLLDEAG